MKSNYYKTISDLFMILFLGIALVLGMILYLINETAKQNNIDPEAQGNLIISLQWPSTISSDVDLWVKSNADNVAVGYSNLGGPLFNLLRDDLGYHADITDSNMEIAYSRGVPDGEYIVNAHLFSLKGAKLPIPIKVVVSLKGERNQRAETLFTVNSQLETVGEERTVARFVLYDKQYVEGSFNTIQEKIRVFNQEGGF